MKKILTLFLFFATHFVNAQNLVNNWSFEDTVACPDNLTQIDRAVGWMSFKFTPDYFNSCASPTSIVPVSVPHNVWGDQNAHSGNAYVGFGAYVTGATNSREFVATLLSQTLLVGQKYFLSFWISSSYGYLNSNNYPHMACNNLGAKFSTVAYSQANPQAVNNSPHIFDTTVVNDTTNWVKISGSFIADSNYKYISIGNFFDDVHTTVVSIGTGLPNAAFYFLDDVRLSTDSNFVNNVSEINLFYSIKIFPNPARDWIAIEGRDIKSIEVFDLCGREIIPKMAVSSFNTKVDISTLSQGVYLIKVKTFKNDFIKKIIHN